MHSDTERHSGREQEEILSLDRAARWLEQREGYPYAMAVRCLLGLIDVVPMPAKYTGGVRGERTTFKASYLRHWAGQNRDKLRHYRNTIPQ
jgi:hypothetical protein